MFLNEGTGNVEFHIQIRNDLSNTGRKRAPINHPSIHKTLIISVMDITVGNQIRASDVDQRIISLQIFRYQTLQIRKFTGARKAYISCIHINKNG